MSRNNRRFAKQVVRRWHLAFLILAKVPEGLNGISEMISPWAYACAYIAVVFCVVRGIPVVIESKRFI